MSLQCLFNVKQGALTNNIVVGCECFVGLRLALGIRLPGPVRPQQMIIQARDRALASEVILLAAGVDCAEVRERTSATFSAVGT